MKFKFNWASVFYLASLAKDKADMNLIFQYFQVGLETSEILWDS